MTPPWVDVVGWVGMGVNSIVAVWNARTAAKNILIARENARIARGNLELASSLARSASSRWNVTELRPRPPVAS